MHCGACVGLHPELLEFESTPWGPLPRPGKNLTPDEDASLRVPWSVCPGRGIPYPELYQFVHGRQPANQLVGPYIRMFVGYSGTPAIRQQAASGGVLTSVLIELLRAGYVDGAVVLRQKASAPDEAIPVIALDEDTIRASAQSIYAVTPTLTILPDMERFEGRLAFVGLPEQVAVLRMLQFLRHTGAMKVRYVLGPYTGTNMYAGAVRAFLRMHGVKDSTPIRRLQWRAGEWPGKLRVEMEDGSSYEAEKFYYNFLIPFYISRHCQIIPDFTNELADISVGDAWSPRYESKKGGFSIITARSAHGLEVLEKMQREKTLVLEDASLDDVVTMHSHMFDFKKRGAFIRLEGQRKRGLPIPAYGYWPDRIGAARRLMEAIPAVLFWFGRKKAGKWLLERVPVNLAGRLFVLIRLNWKRVSRPTRNRGLATMRFHPVPGNRWQEISSLETQDHSHAPDSTPHGH
jgi:coenzyme F420 hydrogenase subunit beta